MAAIDERELASRFSRNIWLYAMRHLRNEDAAAELVQEVLTIVIQALREERVEDVANVERYVLGTCRNVLSGWRRGARRREGLAAKIARESDDRVAPRAPSLDTLALMRCMARLPVREQSVLVLTYCQEHDAEEIGRTFGLAPGNVRIIRWRALRRIRACVEGGAS